MDNLNKDNIFLILKEINQKYELHDGQDRLEKIKLKIIFKYIFLKMIGLINKMNESESNIFLKILKNEKIFNKDEIFSIFIIAIREHFLNELKFKSFNKQIFQVYILNKFRSLKI